MLKVYPTIIALALGACSSANFSGLSGKGSGEKSADAVGTAGAPASGGAPTGANAQAPSTNPAAHPAAATPGSTPAPLGANGSGVSPTTAVGGGSTAGGTLSSSGGTAGGTGTTAGTAGSIGTNGGVLNPNATGSDPSGVGATVSSTGDGTTPYHGPLAGDPTTPPKVVGGGPGQNGTLTQHNLDSIKNCMKMWGWFSPFAPGRTKPDKIIFGNIEIGPANRLIDMTLGTDFSGIDDEEVTANPSLILIISSINLAATDFILPEVTYKFHNPKGWYCIDFSLDLASALKVELKKGAQLADSQFNLSVLSNTQAVAAHQVSILSKVDVVTVP